MELSVLVLARRGHSSSYSITHVLEAGSVEGERRTADLILEAVLV